MNDKNILIYDFEVFPMDWMVVILDRNTNEKTSIINDVPKLRNFYELHKLDIWVGYNSRMYDQFILKGLLLGIDPYYITDAIINQKKNGWQVVKDNGEIVFYNFDIATGFHSLKQLEGFMGSSIQETSVPFDIDRKLTEEELIETELYCTHDVNETRKVFEHRIEEFDSQLLMVEAFNLPMTMFTKTKAQLAATVLEASRGMNRNDEFEIIFPDTLKIGEKYKHIVEWYKNPANMDYKKSLITEVSGIPHIFAWGGLHAAIPNYESTGIMVHCDVASLYPSIMIQYNFMSRNVRNPQKYKEIYDKRLKLKAEKNPMQAPLKIVLNSTYGILKDIHNPLYDPLNANNVCVAGQLLMLDLIEKIEGHGKLVQSNTDGLYIELEDIKQLDELKEIAKEWEKRTRLNLEWESTKKIIQKDVNNYIVINEDGSYESKGSYLKKLSEIDYDLPIINSSLKEYFINNTPVSETVLRCNELREFQKIVKITALYKYALHGDKRIKERVLRVFASKDERDAGVFKVKSESKIEKMANTPDCCFIHNESVIGIECPDKLDKQYYVDMAEKRLSDFLDPKDTSKTAKFKSNIKFISYDDKNAIDNINQDDYEYFYEIVVYLLSNKILNQKQITILTKLNYFEKFGNERELLQILDIMSTFKFGERKGIKKEKICDNDKVYHIVEQNSEDTGASGKKLDKFINLNIPKIFKECEELVYSTGLKAFSHKERVEIQYDCTGGIMPTLKEDDRRKLYVKEIHPVYRKKNGAQFGFGLVAQSLGSGKESEYTIFNRSYRTCIVESGDVIWCERYSQKGLYYILESFYKIA